MLIKGPFERCSGVVFSWVVNGTTFLTLRLSALAGNRSSGVEQPDPWCLGLGTEVHGKCRAGAGVKYVVT